MVRRLLYFNGIAIFSVILFHAVGQGFVALFFWTDRYLPVSVPNFDQAGSPTYFSFRTIEQLAVFSIPLFLFVSGYFIAFATGRTQANIGWQVIWVRLRNLAIPYLVWSIVVLAIDFVFTGRLVSPIRLAEMLLTGRSNPAYYYVPLLAQFYLLTPLIVPLAKSRWVTLIAVVGIIQLIVQLSHYPALLGLDTPALQPFMNLVPKWFFPARIFWFTLGVITGFHIQQIKGFLTRYKRVILWATVLSIPLGILEWEMYLGLSGSPWIDHRETLIDTPYSLLVIFCVIAFDKIPTPLPNLFGNLGSKSYGIYLIHPIVMIYLARALYHLLPGVLGTQILFIPVMVGFGLGIPLLMMWIVDRTPLQRAYSYLFG